MDFMTSDSLFTGELRNKKCVRAQDVDQMLNFDVER